MKKLALGTAQFGLNYGIANVSGQVTLEAMAAILEKARLTGLDTLDTAIAYGDSERNLGEIGVSAWRIVSKIGEMPSACRDVRGWIFSETEASLERLCVGKLFGLLLHRPLQLATTQGAALWSALRELKSQSVIERIGYSVYGPEELELLVETFSPDLVQVPYNVVDRRVATSGWLDRLVKLGAEVHARSVFLQGLLLMPPATRPQKFERWSPLWEKWQEWLQRSNLSPLEASLAFSLSDSRLSRVIVGVDSIAQFEQILAASKSSVPEIPDFLSASDADLVNPSRWNAL